MNNSVLENNSKIKKLNYDFRDENNLQFIKDENIKTKEFTEQIFANEEHINFTFIDVNCLVSARNENVKIEIQNEFFENVKDEQLYSVVIKDENVGILEDVNGPTFTHQNNQIEHEYDILNDKLDHEHILNVDLIEDEYDILDHTLIPKESLEYQFLSCCFCNEKFSSQENLLKHYQIYVKKRQILCDVCNKNCKDRSTYILHKRIHKVTEYNEIKNKTSLPLYKPHSKKSYSCELCNVQFKQHSSLIQHKRLHSGEKPFTCNVCNKTFAWQVSLFQHQQIHPKEKLYYCDSCDAKFIELKSLAEHEKNHISELLFSCNMCDLSFNDQSNLTEHFRIHSGEKQIYSCDLCNQKFYDKVLFDNHTETHFYNKNEDDEGAWWV